ncbi:3-beta hydroxysteroid dehydrogenase [Tumebacillus algifaecis]|uniref:3-beta hydroxysteroid dehydrogenase n=1 Tax=Tumebacillus algifaecis TaxID=1214604 RepID=A0A223D1S8_9BACL|nr:SDR family oxidoreductase [Tumebacillus algifaecis]ASS75415.1 3-beta hydroxysteroid dehydrogenase [Tumebacillus algifaecis]
MQNTYFFTGFPGFIASRLIASLVHKDVTARFELLVQPYRVEMAQAAVNELCQAEGADPERFVLIAGNITETGLAIGEDYLDELEDRVTHVFHLAAVYDLAVPQDIAYRVNVQGTEQVCQFVRRLHNLRRFVYFSTAYVSGDRTGRILETELSVGQQFKNHYEATKYEAELRVQELRSDLPVTIIRPGIVMGDSKTGETAKFDGPYFVMRFLDAFAKFPLPYVGASEARINLVPIDYIVEATVYLAHADEAADGVFHLTDPDPYRAREVYERICQELIGKKPTYTLPSALIGSALAIGAFRRFVKVEKETIVYFSCQAEYDATEAQRVLQSAGIKCPDFHSYIEKAVAFYKLHRDDPDKMILVR